MGEARRRKQLGLPPRAKKTVSPEELQQHIRAAVSEALDDVRYLIGDMNRSRPQKPERTKPL